MADTKGDAVEMTDAELEAWERDQEKAEEEAAAKLRAEARRLAKAQVDKGGRRGVDFEVVTTLLGNFVIKKPDFLTAKRFIDKEGAVVEDVVAFVMPSIVFPDRAGIGGLFQTHAGIAHKLTAPLLRMFAAEKDTKAGK
jgi:hypothetical protein